MNKKNILNLLDLDDDYFDEEDLNFETYPQVKIRKLGVNPRFIATLFKARTMMGGIQNHGFYGISIEKPDPKDPDESKITIGLKVDQTLSYFNTNVGAADQVYYAMESDPICVERTFNQEKVQVDIVAGSPEALRGVVLKLLDPFDQVDNTISTGIPKGKTKSVGSVSLDLTISQQHKYWRAFFEIQTYYRSLYGDVDTYPTKESIFVAFLYYATNTVFSKLYIRKPDRQWNIVLKKAQIIRDFHRVKIPTTAETRKNDLGWLANLSLMYNDPFDGETAPPSFSAIALPPYQNGLLIGDTDVSNFDDLSAKCAAFWEGSFPPSDTPPVPFPFPEKEV